MSTVIPEGLEPLAVWDAGPGWIDAHVEEKITWAREHIERVTDTYRVEFHRLEIGDRAAPFAVVHRYARNENGYKHNGSDGEIATEPPVVVPLGELPPAHLLERR